MAAVHADAGGAVAHGLAGPIRAAVGVVETIAHKAWGHRVAAETPLIALLPVAVVGVVAGAPAVAEPVLARDARVAFVEAAVLGHAARGGAGVAELALPAEVVVGAI